jgi:hypothetical protein
VGTSPTILGASITGNGGSYSGLNAAVPASGTAAYNDMYSSGLAAFGGFSDTGGPAFWFTGTNLNLWASMFVKQLLAERVYIGLFESTLLTTTLYATDTETAHNYACFRWSTTVPDAYIQCITCDGTTQNIQSSGVAMDTKSHSYLIVFNDSAPNVKFYIDGTLVATSTSNLPATSTLMCYQVGFAATDYAQPHIGVSGVTIQSDC